MSDAPFHIWQGVYSSFTEAQGDLDVFEQDTWIAKETQRIKNAKKEAQKPSPVTIPYAAQGYDYILPVVAALSAPQNGPLRILDFGGGMGSGFYDLIAKVPSLEDVEFHIVENEPICQSADILLKDEPRVTFHSKLPPIDHFHIVHLGSSLHYIDDWRGLLATLAAYKPSVILFAELPAGDINKSFVTLQNFYGRHIPVWFWKLDDIFECMNDLGYGLAFQSRYLAQYKETFGHPPMEGLPKNCRLDSFCQLLFTHQHSGVGKKHV